MNSFVDVISKQILRGRILQICSQADPLGAGVEVITAALKKEGYQVAKNQVLEACYYLEGKKLVSIDRVKNEILAISREIAHITPIGIDALEGTIKVDGIELVGYGG